MRFSSELLRPEARLLLGTVSDVAAPETRDRVLAPHSSHLDWDALYRLLVRERAASALHPVADRFPVEIPSPWTDRFRALGAVSGFWQKRLQRTLEEVVGLLAEHGISVCLLKGAGLAVSRYRDFLERPMGDLDLLIEEGRAEDAWDVLRGAGWVWHEDRLPRALYEPRQHLPPLEDPDRTGRVVELHHDLFVRGHPFRLAPEHLRSGAERVEVGGTQVLVPAPTQHLVYICVHFAWTHSLAKGGWRTFRDVAVVSHAPGFRWQAFERMSCHARAEAPCYWTLRLARSLAGVPIPEDTLRRLRPPRLPGVVLRGLERHFTLSLFSADGGCPSVTLGRALWRTAMRPADRGSERGVPPWAYDSGFVELDASSPAASRERRVPWTPRIIRHARNLRSWSRYFQAVLGADGSQR